MGFIQENFVWIVIGVIVILMAIVGYIADKTDFGRKTFDKKVKETKPKEEPKVEIEEEVEERIPEADSFEEEVSLANAFNEIPEETSEKTEESNEEIDPSLFEPLPDIDMNNYEIGSDLPEVEVTSLNEIESGNENEEKKESEVITESEEKKEVEEVSTEQQTDDDIWKF